MDIIKEFWFLIASAVAFAFGYGELKSKVNANTRDIERIERQNNEIMKEMRGDIKKLLQRHE